MPAKAQHITDTDWTLIAKDEAQRDELLAYAASKGVPLWEPALGNHPQALLIGWLGDLMAYEATFEEGDGPLTTVAEFKALCDAYTA